MNRLAQFGMSDEGKESESPGVEAQFGVGLNVRAKARTYLRNKNNGKPIRLPSRVGFVIRSARFLTPV